MAEPLTIFDEIEAAIIELLHPGVVGSLKDFPLGAEIMAIECPAKNVTLFEGQLEQVTMKKFKTSPKVLVTLVVKHAGTVADRHRAANALLWGTIGLLTGQELYVTENGAPRRVKATALVPIRFTRIMQVADRVAYQIEFSTSTTVTVADREQAAELMQIGLQYSLQPGDAVADASDELLGVQGILSTFNAGTNLMSVDRESGENIIVTTNSDTLFYIDEVASTKTAVAARYTELLDLDLFMSVSVRFAGESRIAEIVKVTNPPTA